MQDMLTFQCLLRLSVLVLIDIKNDALGLKRQMKKELVFWSVLSALIMLVLPWVCVTFVHSDGAMAVCLLLFYLINPVYSVIAGVFAGKQMKRLGALPFISSILYLFGVWIFFDVRETAFIRYAVMYLMLGVLSMLISMWIKRCRD